MGLKLHLLVKLIYKTMHGITSADALRLAAGVQNKFSTVFTNSCDFDVAFTACHSFVELYVDNRQLLTATTAASVAGSASTTVAGVLTVTTPKTPKAAGARAAPGAPPPGPVPTTYHGVLYPSKRKAQDAEKAATGKVSRLPAQGAASSRGATTPAAYQMYAPPPGYSHPSWPPPYPYSPYTPPAVPHMPRPPPGPPPAALLPPVMSPPPAAGAYPGYVTPTRPAAGACFDWAKGTCTRGGACRFLHAA